MSTLTLSKCAMLAFSVGIVFTAAVPDAFAKSGKSKAQSQNVDANSLTPGAKFEEIQELRTLSAALTKALAAGDAKGVAALWAPDATYIDSDGGQFKGRDQLQARFASVFSQQGGQNVQFSPDSHRQLTPNVVMAEGTVFRKHLNGKLVPETRYSITFVKQSGNWLIAAATETDIAPQISSNPLEDLSWLIGNWHTEGNGVTVDMKVDWSSNKNFINCTYNTKKSPDAPMIESRQIIGWDPKKMQPVSWHFDSDGGYGYGNWIKKDDQWLVENEGVERNGTTHSATIIFTVNEAGGFTWQSVNRHVNGTEVADIGALKVSKVAQ